MSNLSLDNISQWSPAQLMRYVRDQLTQDPVPVASNSAVEELTVTRKLSLGDEVTFGGTAQTSVGAAGAASALPAAPAGYLRILDNQGQVRVIPYFNP